ncbi:MAG: hypothetical protein ACE15B_04400 [Bryobacteraceae bacterium]
MHAIALLLLLAGEGWWMREPIRWLQTNLRETDAALDARRLVDQAADFRANVLHIGMGGIAAYYTPKTAFHYPSPYLPAGADLFGGVLREAHARGIRVIGRFDLSKTRKEVFDAHPEWFFRKANGDPVVYNGLYSTCINGGYYREQGMKILAEALDRYDVDGLFFNMFGNQSRDYSGNFVGNCHCANCRRMYGKEPPDEADDEYRQFMFRCSREVAAEIGKLIHARRPNAGYFNYLHEHTDGIMSESNTAVSRPLPLWPYSASDNVNRARNSQPGKMAVNLCMQFVDYAWRFATAPPREIALRLWQNLAHGGALAFSVNGTLDQQDRQAVEAAKPVFRWAAEHAGFYQGQESAARVLLLGGGGNAYRGLFRLLTEEHVPFAVSQNLDWMGKREFDLVIAADRAPAALAGYRGRLLIVGPQPPEFPVARVVKRWKNVQGYFRVRDHAAFPSLANTSVIMLNGDYTEVQADGRAALTFIPPSMIGPPEKIHTDQVDTGKPGIVTSGQVMWIPWDLGGLYYRHSLPAHAGILRDLLPKRQLRTNAHPLVEMSLMRQGSRLLLHLINISGHSQTAYFAPVPFFGIRIEVAGRHARARSVRHPRQLEVETGGGYSAFTLPRLDDYEVIVLE